MSLTTPRKRSLAEPALVTLLEQVAQCRPDPDAIASLLREAQDGDGRAFGRLFDLHYDMIYMYAYFRSGNVDVATTVTGKTFELARQHILRAGRAGESFVVWLLRIAQAQSRIYTPDAIAYSTIPPLKNMDVELQQILASISALRPPHREAVLLLTTLHLDLPDIAAVMGESEGQVRNLLLTSIAAIYEVLKQ